MIVWILKFLDFPISSDLLDRGISRFSDFVFSLYCPDLEISPLSDFLLSGLVDVLLFGLFDFLRFSVFGRPAFSGIASERLLPEAWTSIRLFKLVRDLERPGWHTMDMAPMRRSPIEAETHIHGHTREIPTTCWIMKSARKITCVLHSC